MNLSFLDFNYSINFNAIFSLNLIPIWILLCGLIYSTIYTIFSDIKNKLKFVFLIGISILCACLVFCSNNLITGFINYELLTLSTIPIIFYKKNSTTKRGLISYLRILFFCSVALFLPAVLIINKYISPYTQLTSYNNISEIIGQNYASILFIMLLFGIAKTSIFPLQNWLLSAMVAEYPVSAVLHAVAVVNSGIFLLMKISIHIFGLEFISKIYLVKYIIASGIFYSGIRACLAKKIKELLAYSTINQMHLIMFSLFYVDNYASSAISIAYNHSYLKLSLFALFSIIYLLFKNNEISKLSHHINIKHSLLVILFLILSWFLIGLPYSHNYHIKNEMLQLAKDNFSYYTLMASSLISFCYLFRVLLSFFNIKKIKIK